MKTPVAVALIIIGGLLIATPVISDYLARGQIVTAMGEQKLTNVNLSPNMSAQYALGCYAMGGLMVATAIFYSRRSACAL